MAPTAKYMSTSSASRSASDLGLAKGTTPSSRWFTNGRLAATKASRMMSQMDAVWDTSATQRLDDGLRAQRHQAARQDAQDQHQGAVEGEHQTNVGRCRDGGGGDRLIEVHHL